MVRLTYMERNELPDSAFAVKGSRKYPVPTAAMLERIGVSSLMKTALSHARNALARVAQKGTATEKSLVCMKVGQRFPEVHANSCTVHRMNE